MKHDDFQKMISGQRDGISAVFIRLLLAVAALGYSFVIRLRNFLYCKGWFKTHPVNATVISIGNITVGGTGKTPLVIWLYKQITQNSKLKTQNYRCAILTRGYKTRRVSCAVHRVKNARNTQYAIRNTEIDEPAILAESCPQAGIIVNPDRIAGAATAIHKYGAKILIMDDGFQHRRLARDLDIVVIDATRPFGYGRMLPAGLLREPVSSLKRADAVVITRCDQAAESQLSELEKTLQVINPEMAIARTIHSVTHAKSTENIEISPEQLKGKKIFAFCGIGNPTAFLNTIMSLGTELVGSKIYDDHHYYTENDISYIYKQAGLRKADLILTTHKDWPSTHYALRTTHYDIPFAYLEIEIRFLAGEDKLTDLIEKVLAGKIHLLEK